MVRPVTAVGVLTLLCGSVIEAAEPRPLPPECSALARTIGAQMEPSRDRFAGEKSIAEVIAVVHAGALELKGTRSGDEDVRYVTVRSVCHSPRMKTVTSYDVFPKQERRVSEDAPGGPRITRTIETVAYAPPPGRTKDQ